MAHATRQACLALLALSALALPGISVAGNLDLDTFCSDVQRITAGTAISANLTIHETSESYRKSKPGIDPVQIHQYVTPDAKGRPKMVSCKVKSVDHLKAVHGPAATGSQGSCEQVTRMIVAEARAAAPSGAPQIRIAPEERVWTGSSYLSPFTMLDRDAAGTLQLHTRYMRTDWEDWRWYLMPDRLRGHLYCHVIAPEYLARILRGETPEMQPIEVPAVPDAD